jgi:hypothetical protein
MRAWILLLGLAPQEPPARPPEVVGRVAAAIPDGSTVLVTLKTSGGTLRNRPSEFLFYVTAETHAVYVEVPREDRSPAVGMLAQVWLANPAGDRAAFARFARDEKALPRPPAPPPPPPPPAGPAISLEAEEMNLRDVSARELAGASRGKAILFDRPGSRAKATVKLKKGAYEIEVVMQGRKASHDTVTLRIAGREFRLRQEQWGSLAPAKPRDRARAAVEIPKDAEYELRVEFAEPDVWVDRVVLLPVR